MAENDELSGRVVRIDRNFANIAVSGRAGNARLDTSAARRITGSYIADVRDILEMNAQVKVRVVPMSEEALSKIPERFRKTVRRNSQWEVKFFKRDIEPAPQVSQFNDPERYFTDVSSFSGVPCEAVGRIISALLQITFMLNNTSLQKLLPLVKSHFKVKEIPDIGRYLATEGDLERFIVNCPQYFTISSSVVKRCCGFSEEVFNSALTKKTLEIQPPSTAGKRRQTAAASAAGDPVDFKDVLSQTQIIDSVEDCNRVLDPILDQSTRETVVIGLDCEGVNLGKEEGCLTLVQISTWDKKAFLFDAFKNPQLLKGNSSLKKILEHNSILKVIHFCKSDTYSLHHGFGVTLRNVFDTSIAINTLMEEVNRISCYCDRFIPLCMLVGVGGYNKDDKFVKKMLKTPDFWKIRPLTEEMIYYAASNALCLVPRGYTKLEGYCKLLTPLQRALITSSCKDDVENIQQGSNQGNGQVTSQTGLRFLRPQPPFMTNIEDSDDSYDDPFGAYNCDDDYFGAYNSDDDYY